MSAQRRKPPTKAARTGPTRAPAKASASSKAPARLSRAEVQAAQRRMRWFIAGGGAVVVVLALTIAIVANSGSSSKTGATTATPPADIAAVVTSVTAVPATALDTVGAGTAKLPSKVSGTPIAVGAKPEVLYVGAEYCPFCAAERWALTIALSRFGTFSGLGLTHSSTTDVYPGTATLRFHGSSYTSDLIAFTPVEVATNEPNGSGGYKPLDTLTANQQQVVNDLSPGGGIPFIDFGGRYLISGATYDPGVLQGRTANEIAGSLTATGSPIAQAVLGAANAITAAICQLTNRQPADVCTSVAVKAITLPTS